MFEENVLMNKESMDIDYLNSFTFVTIVVVNAETYEVKMVYFIRIAIRITLLSKACWIESKNVIKDLIHAGHYWVGWTFKLIDQQSKYCQKQVQEPAGASTNQVAAETATTAALIMRHQLFTILEMGLYLQIRNTAGETGSYAAARMAEKWQGFLHPT